MQDIPPAWLFAFATPHRNRVHGDEYTVFKFLWAKTRENVAMIPPLYPANIPALDPEHIEELPEDCPILATAKGSKP